MHNSLSRYGKHYYTTAGENEVIKKTFYLLFI